MISVTNIDVFNLENAIRGSRNPLNSWHMSDSGYDRRNLDSDDFIIGEKDMKLAQRLIKAGSDECKFMRQIFVSMDIDAPLYW